MRGECKQVTNIQSSPIKHVADGSILSDLPIAADVSSVSTPLDVAIDQSVQPNKELNPIPVDLTLKHKELWMKQWLSQQVPSLDDINTISVVDSLTSSTDRGSRGSANCISVLPQTVQLFSSDKSIPKYLHRLCQDENSVSANHSFAMKTFESKFVIRNCGSVESKVQVLCSSPAIQVECDADNNCSIKGHSDVW